ncbi:hypothetical protein BGX23_002272 [Mortierella sp. AD031]|nr:hypothetical protein BGX23_002272 [Mortierella sp. AD031]
MSVEHQQQTPIPAPRPRPRPQQQQDLSNRRSHQHHHLVVPEVPNDSTTILQKSLTSPGEDAKTFFSAIISPTTSDYDYDAALNSALESKRTVVTPLKGLTLVTLGVEPDNIAQSAVLSGGEDHVHEDNDDEEEEEELVGEQDRVRAHQEDKSYSDSVGDDDGSGEDVLNAVQELRLIHRPQTGNFLILVDQLRAMRRAAETLQSEDVSILNSALTECERVFERHQRFDQILETDPSKEEAMRALYELVKASSKETIALIQDWSTVYHTLQELALRIRTIASAIVNNNTSSNGGANGKSLKLGRKSLFAKKSSSSSSSSSSSAADNNNNNFSNGTITPQFSPEVLRHQHEVYAN